MERLWQQLASFSMSEVDAERAQRLIESNFASLAAAQESLLPIIQNEHLPESVRNAAIHAFEVAIDEHMSALRLIEETREAYRAHLERNHTAPPTQTRSPRPWDTPPDSPARGAHQRNPFQTVGSEQPSQPQSVPIGRASGRPSEASQPRVIPVQTTPAVNTQSSPWWPWGTQSQAPRGPRPQPWQPVSPDPPPPPQSASSAQQWTRSAPFQDVNPGQPAHAAPSKPWWESMIPAGGMSWVPSWVTGGLPSVALPTSFSIPTMSFQSVWPTGTVSWQSVGSSLERLILSFVPFPGQSRNPVPRGHVVGIIFFAGLFLPLFYGILTKLAFVLSIVADVLAVVMRPAVQYGGIVVTFVIFMRWILINHA
ncbi:hypothetical protein BJ742DRAFT_346712 [Cladochytrium replicatum]|nr:hypothetical protein BJ742DRAFT_346712 [Cladochytrium replicatum]